MKLINNNDEFPMISSDDIIMTGETTGKKLSNVINNHEKDINDLKKYTKWLYKYGGTGSKYGGSSEGGGSGSQQVSLNAIVRINNTILKENKEQQIVLNGEKSITISGELSNTLSTNQYFISIKKGNGSTYLTKNGPVKNNVRFDNVTSDSWYQFNYTTNIDEDTPFTIIIVCTGSENKTISYNVNIVKEAYTFALSFTDGSYNQIVSTDNDLWIDGAASVRDSGLMLNINYNVIAENPIDFEIIGDDVSKMFECGEGNNSYNGTLNLNSIRKESIYIPFKESFLLDDDSIGYYSINIRFTIKESGQAIQSIYKQTSFNLIPQNSYFFKVAPVNLKQKFYKYNSQNLDAINATFNEYDLFYKAYLTAYVNDEPLSNKETIINKIREKYDNNISNDISNEDLKNKIYEIVTLLENNIYIYPTGNIKFYVTAYYGTDTSTSIPISGELNGAYVDIGMTQIDLRSKESISFNISESGVYTFSFYCPDDISKKVTYYMYVYNKVTEIDWYDEAAIIQAQNYWRNGSTTKQFERFNNVYYIQKYNNDTQRTNVITLNNLGSSLDSIGYPSSINDIMISFGIQYSSNNTSINNPIIEILAKTNSGDNSSNKNHIYIYQNKIVTNNQEIPIFLPKEQSYNVKDNSKYHLLTIYKRFIYNNGDKDYYEICIYLDGCLENACDTFTADNSPLITINLLPSNFAVNLIELSYFMHNDNENEAGEKQYNLPRIANDGSINNISYLDDIAISEYFYKYASTNYNTDNIPAYETVKKTIKNLRGFGEVSNGLIKVSDLSVINDIAKEGTVPVMLFEHSDKSKGEFVKFYTSSRGAENSGIHLELESLKYSNGKAELTDIKMPSIPGQGNIDQICNWYIELQGSSTLLNFAKNLNIGIEQKLGGYMILFTPNFKYVNFNDEHTSVEDKKKAKNSYLPETKFTLKTDQVDSSHSNNTAIGAFVNANTTPFVNSTSNNYSNYIKNCLLGFPVLVFIKVNEFTNTNEGVKETYYFLGIMNFNLGRDSYFNMGYYDTEALSSGDCNEELTKLDGSTFKTVYISLADNTKTELEINSSVIVAEIQGGDPHFDFSQAHESVLFPKDEGDSHVMFGDFVPRYTYGASDRDIKMRNHLHRLVENISLSGGYLYDMIGKHFGEYNKGYNAYIKDGKNKSIYASANQVPNYMVQYERIPGKGDNGEPLYSISTIRQQRSIDEKLNDLRHLILDYTDEVESYNAILDYKSVSEYYVVCMAFGLVDSVMKNLNVKTWNASADISSDKIYGKWFAAFYDMDTAFGRNNGGTATSYFAFSDYWFNSSSTLSVATIYRDFFPKADETFSNEVVTNIGYDVPSSYLFAIAKYAPLAFTTGNDDLFSSYRQHTPQNIWARWRTINSDSNTMAKLGTNGLGELKNADYFINKYFIRNLDEIPEQIWNMNYRLKYLKRIAEDSTLTNGDLYKFDTSSGSYELTLNKRPFHGKGINELREWLAGRLHILDAYFNLDAYGKRDQYPILKLNYNGTEESNLVNTYSEYDPQDDKTYTFWEDKLIPIKLDSGAYDWVNSGYYDNAPDDPITSLYMNEDIVMLSDIFSASRQGNKYDNNIYLTFKSKEYSPILVVNAMGALKKYLIENPNNIYSLNISKTGTTNSMFGGSSNWTWIDNLNSLIVDQSIYVKSINLESIVLSQGKCRAYTLLTPALKEISITEPLVDEGNYTEFGGNLNFVVDSGNDNYPCLDKIDISRTSISLTVKGEGVKTVNLTGITSEKVSLTDCLNLTNVYMTSAVINNCEIVPGWSNNIDISNSRIKSLKLSAKDTSTAIRSFKLNWDSSITELELGGFTHIEIVDCPNLSKLTLKNVENIESLQLIRCNNANSLISHTPMDIKIISGIDSTEETLESMEFSLKKFINLKEISLGGTYGISKLNLSGLTGEEYTDIHGNTYHGINLMSGAFDNTDVSTIITDEDQVLFINGPKTFSDSCYTYGNNTLYVKRSVTSLAGMFNYSYYKVSTGASGNTIDNVRAGVILNNIETVDLKKTIYEDITNITDIANMFSGQTHIIVGNDITSYNVISNQLNMLSLKHFTHVRNISGVYAYSQIRTVDSTLFGDATEYVGMNIPSNAALTINAFITTQNVNFEIHSLKYIIDKIPSLISYETMGLSLSLFDESHNINKTYKLQDLFETADGFKQLPKMTEFLGFNVNGNIDWTDAFAVEDEHSNKIFMFPNLNKVSYSLNRTDNSTASYNQNLGDWGLNLYNKKIDYVYQSLNFTLNVPINYKNIINLNVNAYNGIVPVTATEFSMPKYLYENDFIELLNTASTNGITNLDYKFNNIVIIKDSENDTEFKTHNSLTTELPYKFTSCNHTFENMKFKTSPNNTNIIPIIFTGDSLKYFTNCLNWDYAFAGITMYKNLPLNLFNKHTSGDYIPSNYVRNIISMEGIFSNVRINSTETYFKHEDYPEICIDNNLDVNKYNNGDVLEGSYHSSIKITGLHQNNVTIDNPKPINRRIDGDNIIYGEDLLNHLILPFDIFFGCSSNANIKGCFSNSDFEGIMPSMLLANNKLSALNNTFNKLFVIPNRIYNSYGQDFYYLETELLNGLSDYEQTGVRKYLNIDNHSLEINNSQEWYQRHKTYLFVPRNFTDNTTLNNAFNFKIILPKSIATNDNENSNPHNGAYEFYFVFTDKSILNNALISFEKSLPGVGQSVKDGKGQDGEYELQWINKNHIDNQSIIDDSFPNIFDTRAFHNIHYSLMLNEPSDENQSFTVENSESLTYQITNNIRTAINNGENVNPTKYGISYLNFGMTLTENLRTVKLTNFMDSLILRFLFGSIFKPNGHDVTELNIFNTDSANSYNVIFNNIEALSRYVQLPMQSNPNGGYEKALTVNLQYTIKISLYNCGGGNISFSNYTNIEKYNGINPFIADNGEQYQSY